MEYYPIIKENKIMPFAATRMQLKILTRSEVSQKERQIPHNIVYIWNLKYVTNEPIYRTETDSDMENRLVVAKGEGGGSGMDWEFRVSRCKLFHLEWISNEVLLYSTGSSIQSLGIEHDGR